MSAFGVRSPLSRAVITKNLHYNSAEDIHQYLSDLFKDDKTKFYTILTSEDFESFKSHNSPLIIKGCRKLHKLSFFPYGSIQSKINICSCNSCIKDDFVSCLTEKGKTVQQVTEASDDDSTTESELEDDYDDGDTESDTGAYKLRSESVNSVLTKNTTIALYSSSNSLELFYLCKVIDFGLAIEIMVDEYNHIISQGSRYIQCQYYQKEKETKSKIHYKLLPKKVYVLPTQVLSPLVNLIENNVLMIEDYQWLCDSL